MKVLFLLGFFGALMFFDCSSSKNRQPTGNDVQKNSENKMRDSFTYKNKIGEIEYTFAAKILKKGAPGTANLENDVLQIDYEVKNTGEKNYLLYNRGHSGTDDSVVYVETQKGGTIEISQKAFREPEGKTCPNRYVPIAPNASWLKSKQTIKNQIETALPLKLKTPFDDCTPRAEMPAEIARTRFCLGVSEADASRVKINDKGFVEGWQHVKEQQLLCSDVIELK